jgi:hypothetical protein
MAKGACIGHLAATIKAIGNRIDPKAKASTTMAIITKEYLITTR